MERILQREHAGRLHQHIRGLMGDGAGCRHCLWQHLMSEGYGYSADGIGTAAMVHIIKAMTQVARVAARYGKLHLQLREEQRILPGCPHARNCPSNRGRQGCVSRCIRSWHRRQGSSRPTRFRGNTPGKAVVVSIIDMGGRLRLVVQDIECFKPILDMPNLPVARVMWKTKPILREGIRQWITAGGAHHTVLTYDATAEMLEDWAEMMDLEFVHLTENTTTEELKRSCWLMTCSGS